MEVFAVKLENSGRILIPAAVRRRLDLRPGEDVLISVEDNVVTVKGSRAAVVKSIQERLRRYTAGRVLSEELIAERRAEAEQEDR